MIKTQLKLQPKPQLTPASLDLPAKFTEFRPAQLQALSKIETSNKRFIMLQAPTGSGKSLIIAAVQKLLKTRFLYTCTTKQLQAQFVDDFSHSLSGKRYAVELKGRANYPTLRYQHLFPRINASMCTGAKETHCRWCCDGKCNPDGRTNSSGDVICFTKFDCPYRVQKAKILGADLGVVNTALFLNEANFVGGLSGWPWVAFDECVPAGTKIDTPKGKRLIESLKIGDVIYGFDGKQIVESVVEATTYRNTTEKLVGIDSLTMTANHPVWTENRGYVPSGHINKLDKVGTICYNKNHVAYLRTMPPGILRQEQTQFKQETSTLLQPVVLRKKSCRQRVNYSYSQMSSMWKRIRVSRKGTEVLFSKLCESPYYFSTSMAKSHRKDEAGIQLCRNTSQTEKLSILEQKSDLQTRSQAKGRDGSTLEGIQRITWWKRSTNTSASADIGSSSGLANRIPCASIQLQDGQSSNLLQDRYCGPDTKNRHRGRRRVSSCFTSKASRSKKGHLSCFSRMENSSFQKQESVTATRHGSPGNNPSHSVYNLRTSTRNYFANNLLVHNCDQLESSLMSHVELTITKRWIDRLGLQPPARKTVEESWISWARDEAKPKITEELHKLQVQYGVEDMRKQRELERMLGKVDFFLREVEATKWVFLPSDDHWTFKPVFVSRYAGEQLWKHAERFILMSATIISLDEMSHSLGIPRNEIDFVDLPSCFPPERRQIYFVPAANITKKTEAVERGKAIIALDKILDKHPQDKVLVHTVSYGFAGQTVGTSRHKSRMITYDQAKDRESKLDEFKQADNGAVLVASSMDRGIDLPDDLCRVVVVMKFPYLNLGDKQISTRLYSDKKNGQLWFIVSAIRTLIQMTGRAMRSADDYCEIYILDAQFERIYKQNRYLFPEYWRQALHMKS